jgi:hypothetical protein
MIRGRLTHRRDRPTRRQGHLIAPDRPIRRDRHGLVRSARGLDAQFVVGPMAGAAGEGVEGP